MDLDHIHHLYQRASFGILPNTAQGFLNKSRNAIVSYLFDSSSSFTSLHIPTPEIDAFMQHGDTKGDRKRLRELLKKSRNKQKVYNRDWVARMATSEEELRERMTLFWANHFVCGHRNIVYIQKYNNTLRKHALGNFKEFLIAISQEPAMLDYLNNQQNRKNKPNENFARELMELFTIGVGNYTETDVKEAARSFTGWRHDLVGNFRIVQKQHDVGEKNFLGKTGTFTGEDIITILLESEHCATFVCTKLYRYFVNEEVNTIHVNELAKVFRKDYEIGDVMRYLFMADWFYDKAHIRSKIKSPMDFIVGLMRTVPFSFDKIRELLYVEKLLGQVLLMPPNVAGWPGGKNWIDTNTLMVRLKLPSVLLKNGIIEFDVKGEFEDGPDSFEKRNNFKRQLSIRKDWVFFQRQFGKLTQQDLAMHLLGSSLSSGTIQFLEALEEEEQQAFCIQLMSLPEYQLC